MGSATGDYMYSFDCEPDGQLLSSCHAFYSESTLTMRSGDEPCVGPGPAAANNSSCLVFACRRPRVWLRV